MWCGEKFYTKRPKTKEDRREMLSVTIRHLLKCKDHPLTKRIEELVAENKRLKGTITRLLNKGNKENEK